MVQIQQILTFQALASISKYISLVGVPHTTTLPCNYSVQRVIISCEGRLPHPQIPLVAAEFGKAGEGCSATVANRVSKLLWLVR